MAAPSTRNAHSIGFIGLGLMGRPMALNLHAAGVPVCVYNRSQAVVRDLLAAGLSTAATPGEIARRTDTVIFMLPDTPTVETVMDALIADLPPASLVIDMGTTEVSVTRALGARLHAIGCDFIDAPVSGGTIGASAGTLSIMVGGTERAVNRAQPIFDILGSQMVHVGPTGTGQIAKAANQVIVGLTISAVGEALKLAERAGADPARVRDALKGGFAASRILEVHGQRMISGDFTPGGKCTTQRKDLHQALKLAQEHGLSLPTTAQVKDQYDRLIDAGLGDLDHAALIKVLDLAP